jgi:hypothetical protein
LNVFSWRLYAFSCASSVFFLYTVNFCALCAFSYHCVSLSMHFCIFATFYACTRYEVSVHCMCFSCALLVLFFIQGMPLFVYCMFFSCTLYVFSWALWALWAFPVHCKYFSRIH